MSKSAIVIDTPKSCLFCPVCKDTKVGFICMAEGRYINVSETTTKPSWCKLLTVADGEKRYETN